MNITFLIPGFSKCGTTTLCALLARHPDIYIPSVKEPTFFSADSFDSNWPFYESLFEDVSGELAIGEGSTFYSHFDCEAVARERILKHYPDIKLIFIARDPLKRIESSYRELHHSGPKFGRDAPFGLDPAMEEFPALKLDTLFWSRINNYRLHMPEERIHVLFLEDLVSQQQQELNKCYAFLGVDTDPTIENDDIRLNAGDEKLYDSKLLRKLRTNKHTGFKIARIPVPTQNRIFKGLGLRRPFKENIVWPQETLDSIKIQLQDEAHQFLKHYGKPADFWPSMR